MIFLQIGKHVKMKPLFTVNEFFVIEQQIRRRVMRTENSSYVKDRAIFGRHRWHVKL